MIISGFKTIETTDRGDDQSAIVVIQASSQCQRRGSPLPAGKYRGGLTVSDLVRKAIDDFLDREFEGKRPSQQKI
jgi:hypothetical protein